ncbi:hypothetical protein BAUCODRAFT_43968, partial [Baudoinia panamericana UAMH 10762]
WEPLAVRLMPPTPIVELPSAKTISFSWEFLQDHLKGEHWSPAFYFVASGSGKLGSTKAYWMLEGEYEPFVPSAPGQHGAKMTPFFNGTYSERGQAPTEEDYKNTPVFIRRQGEAGYVYFGQYSQLRYSDKLDFDRVMETVPQKVREYWADLLTEPDRPEWITKALMEHYWPKPTYLGPIPTDSTVNTPTSEAPVNNANGVVLEKGVKKALEEHALELKVWEKDARMKVSKLTKQAVLKSFEGADADELPGLRLWWEYLQYVGYDQAFYEELV